MSILSKMLPVVESMGVRIYCPVDGRFAFFNSPYPAHRENTGVDIYPNCDFGGVAPSPVDGEVIQIRRVKSPPGKGFEASDHDTLILIKNSDNQKTVTKLLHVDPFIEIGDVVHPGDSIGYTLRSGYYGWGTSPHVHVEVRSPLDPLRARGGYNLDLTETFCENPVDEIAGVVVHQQPEFCFIQVEKECIGLIGSVNGKPAILDGGIPYYGWFGGHILNAPKLGTLELLGTPIGNVKGGYNNSCIAECKNFQFTVKKTPLLGLSLTIWPNGRPLIKAIPMKINGLQVEKSEWIDVDLKVF